MKNLKYKDAEVQCNILKYSLRLVLSVFLSIPNNANISSQEEAAFERKILRNKATQTIDHENDSANQIIERFLLEVGKSDLFATYNDLKSFYEILNRFKEESLHTLYNHCLSDFLNNFPIMKEFTEYQFRVFEMLLAKAKLKFEKANTKFIKNYTSDQYLPTSLPKIQLSKLISNTIAKSSRSDDKRKEALKKFKKLVTVVRANRKWLKTLNDKRKREFYKNIEDDKWKICSKKAIVIFDKDQYKAERSLLMLTGVHRKILSKESYLRTPDEIEILEKLIIKIPKLNAFPKHIRMHIAELLALVLYDKGREIVREGHEAIGFYIVISKH